MFASRNKLVEDGAYPMTRARNMCATCPNGRGTRHGPTTSTRRGDEGQPRLASSHAPSPVPRADILKRSTLCCGVAYRVTSYHTSHVLCNIIHTMATMNTSYHTRYCDMSRYLTPYQAMRNVACHITAYRSRTSSRGGSRRPAWGPRCHKQREPPPRGPRARRRS